MIVSHLYACGMSSTDGWFERPCWRHAGPAHRRAAKVHSALALLQICRHTALKFGAIPVSSEIHPAVSKRPHLCRISIMFHLQHTTQGCACTTKSSKKSNGKTSYLHIGYNFPSTALKIGVFQDIQTRNSEKYTALNSLSMNRAGPLGISLEAGMEIWSTGSCPASEITRCLAAHRHNSE